ncbi:actin-related protein [Hysterangium stoloniferum]|nr:actin-related protein [Hysterangium stoloniferum]
MSVFRESSVIVIETSKRNIRAGVGLGDFLRAPSIELRACVGLRKNASTSRLPSTVEDGTAYISRTRRRRPVPDAKVSDYLVGTPLDDAIAAGENIEVFWPFEEGDDIRCWAQVEALWQLSYAIIIFDGHFRKHLLFTRLQLRRKQNESPVALSVPSSYSRKTHELLAQLFFERFNVPGFMLVERPLMQLFASNALHGVVIDISHADTTITPIIDSMVQHVNEIHLDIGIRDCEVYLANILRSHQSLVTALSEGESYTEDQLGAQILELVQLLWRDGFVKVPSDGETAQVDDDEGITNIAALLVAGKEKTLIEAGTKKKATAKQTQAERDREREIAALDLVQVEFKGRTLTLGKERHRFCEPLFDPELLDSLPSAKKDALDQIMPLQEGVHMAVRGLPMERRYSVWSGVFISGDITNGVKGLGPALYSRLYPYLFTEQGGNKHAQVLKMPEYFGDFRDKGDGLAAFLGTSIVAKVAFSEPAGKTYLSKADYAAFGPRAILDFSPAMY